MANNNFIKYPSIGNYKDSNKIVEILRSEEILDKCDWVVSEKIHGANFSFITNGNSVVCAKRSGIIKPEEIFFCYQKVYEKYKDSIMKLWKEMDHQQEIRGLNNQIIVYGELFGGYYPHPHVKQVEGVKRDLLLSRN
ncbi:hypothetical protein RclHR1_13770004 [Rhizophagus clarus]|uniref:RNA ligase n=1 Tax=Rhizophagus clarus TaxID=94130 RepID=A0A2Z6R3G7_9GLOM|nr:hypothetical protein RclHR1_13770004 [Rhizophagus clarus]GET04948.1 RNA ligase [Rhizophagus clarus]